MKNFYKRGMLIIMFLLVMALLAILAMGQAKAATSTFNSPITIQQEITGKVTGPSGQPLLGVTVMVKNKNYGTTTNLEGGYTITATNGDVIVFSFLGYKPQEITVNNQSQINISLEEDVASLDEVQINAGYYTVTERERTGNISRVTAEEIESQPVFSPLQALQGRMAGVEVQQPSGISGLATSIRIRGRNSLRLEGDYPLFIIDGVPINSSPISSIGPFSSNSGIDPLNTMNLSNIESIEVLKDADATAIYGSRGANGVVLITTKTGSRYGSQTGLEVRFYSGVSNVSNKMKLMNTAQYISVRKEAFENDGVEPLEFNALDLILWDQNQYTDWQEELMGETATINNLNLSLTGGSENTTFLLGGSYQVRGDVFPGDFGYKKVTSNFNLHHNSKNGKFNLDFSTNYGIDDNQLFFGTNFVHQALTLPPNAPELYNDDGSLNWADGNWTNPFAVLYKPTNVESNNLISNLSARYELLPGLTLRTNLGYSNLSSEEVTRHLLNSFNPSTWSRVTLRSFHSNTERKSWIIEPQLSFSKSLDKFNLDLLAGATLQQNESGYLYMEGSGYGDDSTVGNLNAADEVNVYSNQNIDYKYSAIFGRLGINLDKKYYLNLTGRRDGSSKFGPNRRFANFWAIGGAWIFTEKPFFRDQFSVLSFGKIRGSYGNTGNDHIPDYGYLDTYEATRGPGGLYPTKLYNPNYSWEINRKLEAALNLGFFKDRLNLEVSWYRNRSSNQLIGYPLPATTGFNSVQANLPATIENTGWEIGITSQNLLNNDFKWNTSINFTIPKNKLVEFNDLELTPYRTTYKVGEPLDITLLYGYDGIDSETGFYRLTDVNDDGRYNFNDRVVSENLGRKLYGGIQNNIEFKNLSLNFLFEYVKQKNRSYLADLGVPPGNYGNNSTEVLSAWRETGDVTNIQRLSQGFPSFLAFYDALNSELFITDASFLRLKTLTLSYQFKEGFSKKIGIKDCRLSLNAQNLFTLTNYLGLDPQGGKVVPPLRTITSGLQISL